VELLASVNTWMNDRSGKTVYWLSGGAGTGKTTVAQSVANIAQQLDILFASFFFSRSADDRHSYGNVIPTLAYQLATSAAMRSGICKAISITTSTHAPFKRNHRNLSWMS
jgi:Mrp family chromosome partitioning ATPase